MAIILQWPDKDSGETLDYTLDWTARLNLNHGDTIASSSWAITGGGDTVLTLSSSSHTSYTSTVWASSGTVGANYRITCTVVTTGSRTLVQSVYLRIVQR
jgi:hypothetical protein